ncbi:MAG: hypothetical protein VZR64_00405 [Eubacterium sp.]|nr:hypothetical protein [Eubacterium sp.]
MIAKFKDGTPCTIRALLAFAEKCYCANFIVLTEDCELLIRSIDRKANGRIRRIAMSVMKPLVINGEKSTLYKTETKFEGNEKAANDFLDSEVFSKGIIVDENKMTTLIRPSDDDICIWSLKEEFKLKKPLICKEKQVYAAYKETPKKSLDEMLAEGIPPLKKKPNPRTIMVSSACEGMHMDTD